MKKALTVIVLLLAAVLLLGIFAGPSLLDTGLKLLYPQPYGELVRQEAGEFSLDPNLVYAVMRSESGFDPNAESRAGAKGLMQLTPQTFRWMVSLRPPENGGENMLDPRDNLHCGCALLRLLLDQYGDLDVALCAYNAGMGNVSAWLEDSDCSDDGKTLRRVPYPETGAYLEKVKRSYGIYARLYS